MIKRLAAMTLLTVCAGFAQRGGGAYDERRAEIRGGGGDRGKCTVEVEVDGVAEIGIAGDLGRLRTISGSPASWRRFVCNTMMPASPAEFRFRGIDGRGMQELIREPGGRSPAVIRIEDPKGGREGYTFDIEWRGGSGGSGGDWGSGWGSSGGSGWGGGWGGSNREINFNSNGTGTFSNANGLSDTLSDCRVRINRSGDAEVRLNSRKSGYVTLRGRVTRVEGDRISAAMSGNGISGDMTIRTDGPDRVREIRMSGNDPVGFDLRWRR